MINRSDAVAIGYKYYHNDCAELKLKFEEIEKVFLDNINSNVVISQLRRVIHNIVLQQHVDADYLLFGLMYYISHGIHLNYPAGLYYVVKNKDVDKSWKTIKSKEYIRSHACATVETTSGASFNYVPQKQASVADLFGGC